jgi:sigma-B regulation protein RsbU (phosphoserine phosphatase)
MLQTETDIEYHYTCNPAEALELAGQLKPTVILQDLVMPEIDGITLVKSFRAHESTVNVPMIVLSSKEEPATKAEAFAAGANDYLVKLPDPVELIARIRYHSGGYIALLQRNQAFAALEESQNALAAELNEAADYVRCLSRVARWGVMPSAISISMRTTSPSSCSMSAIMGWGRRCSRSVP